MATRKAAILRMANRSKNNVTAPRLASL